MSNRLMFTGKRGSLFVDAACTLPVFIISICMLLALINQAGAEETAYKDMASRAKTQVDVIAASGLDMDTDVLFQTARPGNGVLLRLVYRPFIGESRGIADEDDELVYVFPKRGIRYHRAGCGTMIDGDREVILTNALRREYSACRICKPGSLPNGAYVCLYSDNSTVYHRRSCASITKSFETMTRSEAEKHGYTPCLLCIGEEHSP
ncbi:MAG: hypothetical protein IJM61_04200 [Firmicutes bacterium]|nr:hypothetical protein [Bacillota bacterium]